MGENWLRWQSLSQRLNWSINRKKRAEFFPVEEFKTLWGEANPCLQMIKALNP